MADFQKLSDESLDAVVGGAKRRVNTHTDQNAVIRKGPGKGFAQVDSVGNGSFVYTTGESVYNDDDGRTWYEISSPCHGWIAGSLIGY